MEGKVVVHMKDGAIHKGVTHDFVPGEVSFHLLPAEGGGVPMKVDMEGIKALFQVRDYVGNRSFVARREFALELEAGRKAILKFRDGEKMWGTIPDGQDEKSSGFFFLPVDEEDNNIRIYVVSSSLDGLQIVS